MSLIELRDYATQKKNVTLKELAMHFNAPAGLIENMMSLWVKKGVFSADKMQAPCTSCACGCAVDETVYHLVS